MELIITVAMLALIVLPLSSLFFSSSQLNIRSAELGDINLITENITEQFEAMDFDSWLSSETPTPPEINNGLGVNTVGGTFLMVDPTSGNYEPLSDTTPLTAPYRIEYTGMSAGYDRFNAVVTLDPGMVGDNYGDINALELFDTPDIDYIGLQSYEPPQNPDMLSWYDFLDEARAAGYDVLDEEAFRARVNSTRQISVNFSTAVPEGETESKLYATIKFSYDYSFPVALTTETILEGVVGTTFEWETGTNITPPDVYLLPEVGIEIPTADTAPNIMFMFYPWYENGDTVEINNSENMPFTLAVVKQKIPQMSDVDLDVAEATPGLNRKIELIESTSGGTPVATILSNFHKSFSVSGSDLTTVDYLYTFNSGSSTLDIGDLSSFAPIERIYTITVEIYPEQADGSTDYTQDPLYTFSTTNLQ